MTHPDKSYFLKQVTLSKLDIVRYYLSVAQGALEGVQDRPFVLKRSVNGTEAEAFYQKRAGDRPIWLPTVTLAFPSGRTADEVVIDVDLSFFGTTWARCGRLQLRKLYGRHKLLHRWLGN